MTDALTGVSGIDGPDARGRDLTSPDPPARGVQADRPVRLDPREVVYRRLVGRRVRLQRQWLGMAQQDVADAAGVTRNFVGAIEHGGQRLDAWRLGLLADALGTTLAWLLDRERNSVTFPAPAPVSARAGDHSRNGNAPDGDSRDGDSADGDVAPGARGRGAPGGH